MSYDGVPYESLTLLELSIANDSSNSIQAFLSIIALPPATTIVARGFATNPITVPVETQQPQDAKQDQHYYHIGSLHQNDVVSIWLLLSGSIQAGVEYYYRGTDDVVIAAVKAENRGSDIGDFRSLLIVTSIFIIINEATLTLQENIAYSRPALMIVMLFALTHFFMRIYARKIERGEK